MWIYSVTHSNYTNFKEKEGDWLGWFTEVCTLLVVLLNKLSYACKYRDTFCFYYSETSAEQL